MTPKQQELLARIDERVSTLLYRQAADTTAQNARLDKMDSRLEAVEDMATRWKGALAIILAIGGLLTWFSGVWQAFWPPK